MDDVLQRPTCQFREACSVIISFILTTLGFVFVVIESKPARGYVVLMICLEGTYRFSGKTPDDSGTGIIFLLFMFGWTALLVITYLCCKKAPSQSDSDEEGASPANSTEYCLALVDATNPQRYIASLIPVAPTIPHLPRLRQSQAEDKPPDYSQLEFSAIEVESNDSSTHTSCGSVPPPSYEDVANAN